MADPATGSAYPGALDALPEVLANDREDAPGLEHDVVHTAANAAINNVQAELGTTADEPGTIRGRLADVETLAGAAVPGSALGVSVATLVGGTVPSGQLPSYVDDVLEYADLASFPGTGVTGKIYVALDTNYQYRWTGSIYLELVHSPGTSDAVPEGTSNLYFTAARVLATVLAGLSLATNAAITTTDSVLSALGKLQKQITDLISTVSGKQAASADLSAIAGLSPTNDDVLQRKAGAWTNRSMAQLKTDLVLDPRTAGDAGTGFVNYNGTTQATGQFDGGATAPAHTTRLNYDGYFYATRYYGDGSQLTNLAEGAVNLNTAPNIIQALMGRSSWAFNLPIGGTTTSSAIGYNTSDSNSVGTLAAVSVAATNAYARQHRRRLTSSSTAGSHAESYHAVAFSCLDGGFQYTTRFGFADAATVANARFFCGLGAAVAAHANADPSSDVNIVGFGADTGDANVQFLHNDASGTATKIDLGSAFPANTASTDWYEGQITSNPASGIVQYALWNISTGTRIAGTVNTNLPAGSTLLARREWRNNGTTALAVRLELGGWSWQFNRDGQ